MTDGESCQVPIRYQVSGAASFGKKAAEDMPVVVTLPNEASPVERQPGSNLGKRGFGVERRRKDGRVRTQPKKAKEDHPGEAHGLISL